MDAFCAHGCLLDFSGFFTNLGAISWSEYRTFDLFPYSRHVRNQRNERKLFISNHHFEGREREKRLMQWDMLLLFGSLEMHSALLYSRPRLYRFAVVVNCRRHRYLDVSPFPFRLSTCWLFAFVFHGVWQQQPGRQLLNPFICLVSSAGGHLAANKLTKLCFCGFLKFDSAGISSKLVLKKL